jgi:2-polyprenyl-3-methyl-5-hydroxy-6-metoxy-1,4-benzoquinol methylase
MIKKTNTIERFVLPGAVDHWEKKWRSKVLCADIANGWRTRYYLALVLLGLLLISIDSLSGLSFLSATIMLDYILLRSRARLNFQRELNDLKALLGTGFYDSEKKRNDKYNDLAQEDNINSNLAVNLLREAWLVELKDKYIQKKSRILDAGCKGGEVCNKLVDKAEFTVGLDLNFGALKHFHQRNNGAGIQANILNLPLKAKIFDLALLTEVLEHLYDPIKGLKEIASVLNDSGILILSTDNRNQIKLVELLNPLIVLERITGLLLPDILRPKNLIWKWEDSYVIFHTEFSKTELIDIIDSVQAYEILSMSTYSFFTGISRLCTTVRPHLTAERFVEAFFPIERILSRTPVLKNLGGHWIIILAKRAVADSDDSSLPSGEH